MNKNYIYSLQLIRILAAFIVMLFHINAIFEAKYGMTMLQDIVHFGKSGVHIFFVLSGYVMYMVHKSDIGKGLNKAKLFANKRFTRIYPTYWILTSFVLLSMYLTSGEVKAYKYSFTYIFQSYSLVEFGMMDGNPLIPAAWTLFHEIKFYAFFCLLILIKNSTIRNIAIYSVAALTLFATFFNVSELGVFNFYFSSWNILFALGVLSGWITDHYSLKLGKKKFVVIAIIAFIIVSIICNHYLWLTEPRSIVAFGIVSFLVVTALSCYETVVPQNTLFKPSTRPAIMLLANITYCLYLIHYPVYTIVVIIAQKISLSYGLVIVIMIISSFVASIIYYKIIEEPLMVAMKKRFFAKKQTERFPASVS